MFRLIYTTPNHLYKKIEATDYSTILTCRANLVGTGNKIICIMDYKNLMALYRCEDYDLIREEVDPLIYEEELIESNS